MAVWATGPVARRPGVRRRSPRSGACRSRRVGWPAHDRRGRALALFVPAFCALRRAAPRALTRVRAGPRVQRRRVQGARSSSMSWRRRLGGRCGLFVQCWRNAAASSGTTEQRRVPTAGQGRRAQGSRGSWRRRAWCCSRASRWSSTRRGYAFTELWIMLALLGIVSTFLTGFLLTSVRPPRSSRASPQAKGSTTQA